MFWDDFEFLRFEIWKPRVWIVKGVKSELEILMVARWAPKVAGFLVVW